MKSMHQALHEDVLQEVKIEAENTMTSDDQVTLVDNDVIRKYINNVMDSVIEKKKQRKAINEEVQALYTEAESKGINRKALKAALSRYELSEEERRGGQRHHGQEDHGRAVHRKQLAERLGPDEIVVRPHELPTHQHRLEPADQQEGKRGDAVENANPFVIRGDDPTPEA